MMCEECEEFPAQYVAYFNKAGGKLWRPAQKAPTPWAIDIRAVPVANAAAAHGFVCDGADAPASVPAAEDEREAPQSPERIEVG
jgi:hypothetical protein